MCLLKKSKCCLSCLTVCLILVLTMAITIVVLLNQTPNQIGFGDKAVLGETTLSDIGLADLKVKQLIKGFQSLRNFKESDVITNPFDTNTDAVSAKSNFKNSSIDGDNVNFSSVLSSKVVYDNRYMIVYKDTTLAFILNNAINVITDNESNSVSTLGAEIKEITISNNDKPHVKIVLTLLKIQMQLNPDSNLKSLLSSAFANATSQIPVLTLEFDFTVSPDGIVSIQNNGNNNPISCVINSDDKMTTIYFTHLIESETKHSIDEISKDISNAFISLINNIGLIGNASTNDHKIVISTPYFGTGAVSNGSITVITYND